MLTFLGVEDMFSNKTEMTMARTMGFFRKAMDALVEARSRQAARYVNGALLMLDDETLKANGYTREELKRNGATRVMI